MDNNFPFKRQANFADNKDKNLDNTSESTDFNNNVLNMMPGTEGVFFKLITQQVTARPNSIAVQYGDSTITYKNFVTKVNQLANLLVANNVKVGDKIGLITDRSIEMVICLLAILKSGAAYVALDPNFPFERIKFMLDDSGCSLLLSQKKYDHYFKPDTHTLLLEDTLQLLPGYPDTEPNVNVTGHDLAYVMYTSGSTGRPKGVQIEHQNLNNLLLSIQKKPGLDKEDIFLAVATISFDIAGLELFLPLITGAKLIVADSEMVKDGNLILQTIRKENVTVMQATPYTWRMMLASGWDKKLNLKILCGGEAMPRDLADKLLPRCKSLWNLYGPTETTIYSTGKQITAEDNLITIGPPIDNTEVFILDGKLNQLPVGQEGELCIAGAGVSKRGYLNQPALTAQKFIENKFTSHSSSKIYRTGDLAKILPNGDVQYMGRIDNQVKIRGYRIETEEVEYNLMQQRNIKQAVVTVYEDNLANQWLIAYVVTYTPLAPADKKYYFHNWVKALKAVVPDYMVPADFVLLPELPLTSNGKIDRKQLPKPRLNHTISDYAAPESEIEKMVADIWIKYLGNTKLGIHDNFFELGGHSLIAVQIMTMISKTTGSLLPIATLFKYPTVHKLAQLIESKEENNVWKSLVPIKPGGNKMPLYIIHGEGLNVLIFNSIAMNVDIEQPVYGLQSRGLNGKDPVPDSIEQIATLYVDEILEQNPIGPYAIAGYSFGGYVAIEMVKQLELLGKKVSMLAMFDTNFQNSESQMSTMEWMRDKVIRQFRKGGFIVKSLLKDPAVTIAYQIFMIKTRLQAFGLFKDINPENVPDYMQPIVDKLRIAVKKYKMTPYNGVIHLFKSKVKVYFIDDFEYLGWSKFALGGVKVHDVPGDHRDMLLPPNDKEFAKILQQSLDEAAKID